PDNVETRNIRFQRTHIGTSRRRPHNHTLRGPRSEVRSGITVTVGAAVAVNMDMDVGDIQKQVQVSSDSAQHTTTTASIRSEGNSLIALSSLDINGRSPQ